MANLKPIYDALQEANAEVETILSRMVAASEDPNEDMVQKALEMQPALEAARKKANEISALYDVMVKAGGDANANARKFVPVNEAAKTQGEQSKTLTRAEFEALTPQRKYAFLNGGGTVVAEVKEE